MSKPYIIYKDYLLKTHKRLEVRNFIEEYLSNKYYDHDKICDLFPFLYEVEEDVYEQLITYIAQGLTISFMGTLNLKLANLTEKIDSLTAENHSLKVSRDYYRKKSLKQHDSSVSEPPSL